MVRGTDDEAGVQERPPLDVLDEDALRRWALRARAALGRRREEIDALNVFPVPDGDTGTNMYLTLDTAVGSTAGEDSQHRLPSFARAAVLGARGNSGVILSQLVRGLLEVVAAPAGAQGAGAQDLARAFRRASDLAYACVGEPTEGTILTVARAAARAAEARADQGGATLLQVLDAAVGTAREALARTPSQLAQLQAAGVVDAGASGLVTVLEALRGVVVGEDGPAADAAGPGLGVAAGEEVPADYAGRRHEVVLTLRGASAEQLHGLRSGLCSLGDSVVVSDAGQVARVHAHVDDVDAACHLARSLGRVEDLAVTDLHAQARAVREGGSGPSVSPGAGGAQGPVAPGPQGLPADGPLVLACTEGEGLSRLFAAEGALVVPSGPGRRASVGALLAAVETHPGRDVVILPNDPDVFMTAETTVAELRSAGRRAAVVPTRSDVAGLAALAVLDRGADLDEAVAGLAEAARAIRSGAVARATRDATTPVGPCRRGDVLGLVDDTIVLVGTDVATVTGSLLDHMLADGGELVSLVAGEVDPDVTARVVAACEQAHPEVEVAAHQGGQTAYLVLVGVE